jgi:general stress protein YciG
MTVLLKGCADAQMSSSTAEEGGESLLSDDSSFYGKYRLTLCNSLALLNKLGDDDLKAEYEERAASFDPTAFWESHEHDLQRIAEAGRRGSQVTNGRNDYYQTIFPDDLLKNKQYETPQKLLPPVAPADTPMELDATPHKLYNPWEGDEMAKQLNETLDTFLSRLPPSTATVASGPWIWIANPSFSQRNPRSDVTGFKTSGNELLQQYMHRKANFEAQNPGKPPSSITRMLNADREWLEQRIVDLAKSKGVTDGKWMLFPSANMVDDIWRKVAKATLEGTLGYAAKVATDDGSDRQRLICVYTEDFTDEKDVRRVLDKMQELNLIKGEQGIYYKCDAYTYLDIMSGNDYKLQASMYSSKEMLNRKTAERQ